VNGNLTEHLAVQQNARVHQAIHKAAVTRATHSTSRRDAGNPQTSHVAAALTAITPGIRTGTGQGDFGLLLVTTSGSPVAAGGTKNSLSGFGASSTFGSTWHVEHSFLGRGFNV
jgi:hypothetical protein